MKRIHLIGILSLALILLLTMSVPVMAKPINNGYKDLFLSFTDTSGRYWVIQIGDYYDTDNQDSTHVYCPNLGINIDNSGVEVSSHISFSKLTATFRNQYINITVYGLNSTYVWSGGSRKDGTWYTGYALGPGTVSGTVYDEGQEYPINFTTSTDIMELTDYHEIVK